MIYFFNGQDSQPIQPLLLHAAPQVGLNEFQLGKGWITRLLPLSHMSETIAGQCTPHRRWMLRSDNPQSASWQIGRLRTAARSLLKLALNDRSCAGNVIAMSLSQTFC